LAFDLNKGRLGRGKGFYDRYFSKATATLKEKNKPLPYLLGVAFKEQIVPEVPLENHDRIVDDIVVGDE